MTRDSGNIRFSPGALVKEKEKNAIKLIFSEYLRDIMYYNISKAQEKKSRHKMCKISSLFH